MLVAETGLLKSMSVKAKKMTDVVLSVRGLRKAFGGQVVLDDISLDLRKGEVVLLKGENGSGKTTLLNILTGNLEPDRGELNIKINGSRERFSWPRPWWKELNPFDHFTPERLAWEGVGRVWQDIRLFPTMTTLENVAIATPGQMGENPAFALVSLKARAEEIENIKASSEWLKGLGLGERLDSSCDKISLGQMKRVAIARAIQAGAKVLFLDEPLSGLDKNGIVEVMAYLESLVKENFITLVIVEHVFNIPVILGLADTVWSLVNGKLTINKNKESNHKNCEEIAIHHLLNSMAGESGHIYSEELHGGATITTFIPKHPKESSAALEVKDLEVKRGIRTVINRLSFSLKSGQFSILQAPNGWGKSTLLEAIAGVHPIESGVIRLNGKDFTKIPTHRRIKSGLAYLRSSQSVFTSLSVDEHRRLANTQTGVFHDRLNTKSKGSFLSGGEKQKLLIEMLPEADVFLFDEPMIGLDEESIDRIIQRIRQMNKMGKTLLITIPEFIKSD